MNESKTEMEIVADALDEIIEGQEDLENRVKALCDKADYNNKLLNVIKNWITFFGVIAVIGMAISAIYIIMLVTK